MVRRIARCDGTRGMGRPARRATRDPRVPSRRGRAAGGGLL